MGLRSNGKGGLNYRISNQELQNVEGQLTSPLDIRGDLNNAAIAAKFEPRKPRFSLFEILRFISAADH